MFKKNIQGTLVLILVLAMSVSFGYGVAGPNGITGLVSVNATAVNFDHVYVNSVEYTDNIITGAVNGSAVNAGQINSSLLYAETLYLGDQQISDYLTEQFFSPDITTAVVERGATLPLNVSSRKGQLFYLNPEHKMYYFNTTHWVGVGGTGTPPDVPPGGGTVNATGRVSIVGEQIYDANGDPLYLAGAIFTAMWSISSNTPDTAGTRPEMFNISKAAGANLMVISINSELWYSSTYRDNIDTFATWAVENDQFFVFKLQSVGSPDPNSFSRPGGNYRLTLPENVAYKNRAIGMWEDLATSYANTTGFIGFSLLNEPWRGNDYTKWDDVITYYYDSIDAVVAIDPDCIFFVMAPRQWGVDLRYWAEKGYINRPNIVYEYHMYYLNWYQRPNTWASEFYVGNEIGGKNKLIQHYENYVLPAYYDGYPVYCGEFGVQWDSDDYGTPINNWELSMVTEMATMQEMDIHYSVFHHNAMANDKAFSMEDSTGRNLIEKGQVWYDNIPSGLTTP